MNKDDSRKKSDIKNITAFIKLKMERKGKRGKIKHLAVTPVKKSDSKPTAPTRGVIVRAPLIFRHNLIQHIVL